MEARIADPLGELVSINADFRHYMRVNSFDQVTEMGVVESNAKVTQRARRLLLSVI
jgi:hypothetical protein